VQFLDQLGGTAAGCLIKRQVMVPVTLDQQGR
jgi:hypothetical protein